MSFNRIEHTTGLPHKTNLYFAYDKIYFLSNHFLVVEDYELSKVQVILLWNASEFYFNPSVFFYIICFADDVLLSELMILLSTHHVTNYMTCHNKVRCWCKIFLFSISYFLILNCQDLVLNVIYSNSITKDCYPELA